MGPTFVTPSFNIGRRGHPEFDPAPGHIGDGLVSLTTRQRLRKFMHMRQEVGGIVVISDDKHKVSGLGQEDGVNSDVLGGTG